MILSLYCGAEYLHFHVPITTERGFSGHRHLLDPILIWREGKRDRAQTVSFLPSFCLVGSHWHSFWFSFLLAHRPGHIYGFCPPANSYGNKKATGMGKCSASRSPKFHGKAVWRTPSTGWKHLPSPKSLGSNIHVSLELAKSKGLVLTNSHIWWI